MTSLVMEGLQFSGKEKKPSSPKTWNFPSLYVTFVDLKQSAFK
jgi:hypothetical protein